MKRNVLYFIVSFMLFCSGLITIADTVSNTTINGIRVHFPAFELFRGSFDDQNGNHLFLFTSGIDVERGDAWVLKMNADGNDTLMRSFALADTSTVLYTGYYTPQHTYMFFGQIHEDTSLLSCSFSFLWVLETDTLLHVLSSKRYPVPYDYKAIAELSGYSLSPGKFTLLGTYVAPNSTVHIDDLFLAQFNSDGDTIKTEILNRNLNQSQHYTSIRPENNGFAAIVSGFNIHLENEMMMVDSNMNFQLMPFIGWPDLQFPMSFIWLNDTLLLAACEKHTPPSRYWDMHVSKFSLSGIFYHDLYFGYNFSVDYPAWNQAIIKSADNGYYFAGALDVGGLQFTDTMMFCRLDENLNPDWLKHYYDIENFVIQSLYLKPDGNMLVAASYYDYTQGQYSRDLIFFTVDSNHVTGTGINPLLPADLKPGLRISPNPGTDKIVVESRCTGTCFVRLLNLYGSEVLPYQEFKDRIEINTSTLQSGIYLVEMIGPDKRRIVLKWVKGE